MGSVSGSADAPAAPVDPGWPVCGTQPAMMVAPAPRPTRRRNSRRSMRSVIRSTAPCPVKAQDMLHHDVKSVSRLASPPTARGRASASGLYIRRRGSVDDRKRDVVTTVSELRVDRRRFLIGAGAVVVAVACGPGRPPAGGAATATATGTAAGVAIPALPTTPISFSVIDVAGQLQLTKAAVAGYGKQNAKYVSGIKFETATAPELPAKLKAQQQANNVQLHFVLTGSDGLSAGVEQGLFTKIMPDYDKKFPSLMDNYLQPKAQDLAQGFGILVVYGNYGPTLTYAPKRPPNVPNTADEILAEAKANPMKISYTRPATPGPGRAM